MVTYLNEIDNLWSLIGKEKSDIDSLHQHIESLVNRYLKLENSFKFNDMTVKLSHYVNKEIVSRASYLFGLQSKIGGLDLKKLIHEISAKDLKTKIDIETNQYLMHLQYAYARLFLETIKLQQIKRQNQNFELINKAVYHLMSECNALLKNHQEQNKLHFACIRSMMATADSFLSLLHLVYKLICSDAYLDYEKLGFDDKSALVGMFANKIKTVKDDMAITHMIYSSPITNRSQFNKVVYNVCVYLIDEYFKDLDAEIENVDIHVLNSMSVVNNAIVSHKKRARAIKEITLQV